MSKLEVSNAIDSKANSKGAISIIFGALSIVTSFMAVGFILGIIGLIYGVIGVRQINRFKQNGKRIAVTGILCCLIGIFLSILFSVNFGNLLFS